MREYVEYKKGKLEKLYCMRGSCTNVLGYHEENSNTFKRLPNQEVWPVLLSDGSFQNMLVCSNCLTKCNDNDLDDFDKARKFGWEQELIHRKGLDQTKAQELVSEFSSLKEIVRLKV